MKPCISSLDILSCWSSSVFIDQEKIKFPQEKNVRKRDKNTKEKKYVSTVRLVLCQWKSRTDREKKTLAPLHTHARTHTRGALPKNAQKNVEKTKRKRHQEKRSNNTSGLCEVAKKQTRMPGKQQQPGSLVYNLRKRQYRSWKRLRNASPRWLAGQPHVILLDALGSHKRPLAFPDCKWWTVEVRRRSQSFDQPKLSCVAAPLPRETVCVSSAKGYHGLVAKRGMDQEKKERCLNKKTEGEKNGKEGVRTLKIGVWDFAN